MLAPSLDEDENGAFDGPEAESGAETDLLCRTLERIHNAPDLRFTDVERQPAWALDVLPLSSSLSSQRSSSTGVADPTLENHHHRVLIMLSYSHSHFDGLSGLAFHRTFHPALEESLLLQPLPSRSALPASLPPARELDIDTDFTIDTKDLPALPSPADTPANMSISWSYLLGPLLGAYLPSFLARWLGVSDSLSSADEHTWTGVRMFVDERTEGICATTSVEVCSISKATLVGVLSACRRDGRGGKLTGMVCELVAESLGRVLSEYGVRSEGLDAERKAEAEAVEEKKPQARRPNFVAKAPVNMRRALGLGDDVMGNIYSSANVRVGSGTYYGDDPAQLKTQALSRSSDSDGEDFWARVHAHSLQLAAVAQQLKNQPIALLRYVRDMAAWMRGQLGEPRDASFELSNLGSFDARYGEVAVRSEEGVEGIAIESMLFSQPAAPLSAPLSVNIVGVREGGLSVCVSWQVGALGLEGKDLEGLGVERRGDGPEGKVGLKGQEGCDIVEGRERRFVKDLVDGVKAGLERIAQLS